MRKLLDQKDKQLGQKSKADTEIEKTVESALTEDVMKKLSAWQIVPKAVEHDVKLGSGSFGVVFEGKYRERAVAIKTMAQEKINDENMQRFVQEILLMSRLHHPNIIGFVGCVLDKDNLSIILEYAKKGDLKMVQLTGAGQKWTFHNHKLRVLLETVRAMEYLHSLDPIVIHGEQPRGF